VQCSAVQCSAVQCSAVQCSAVQCSAQVARLTQSFFCKGFHGTSYGQDVAVNTYLRPGTKIPGEMSPVLPRCIAGIGWQEMEAISFKNGCNFQYRKTIRTVSCKYF
jgi:hypothetical protein